MAESMKGLKRSHRCTEVNSAMVGKEVTVMGWVQKSRNKGGIIFVDLRDRSGILQTLICVRFMMRSIRLWVPKALQRQRSCVQSLL